MLLAPDKMRRMATTSRYWFPAKRHGWGWGLPRTWQGWAVLGAYVFATLAPAVFLPGRLAELTLAVVLVATPVLIWVCFKKGEPPHRQWR